jgi:hypothetical protein
LERFQKKISDWCYFELAATTSPLMYNTFTGVLAFDLTVIPFVKGDGEAAL